MKRIYSSAFFAEDLYMMSGTFWDLFCETGDIAYYLLFKETDAAPAYQNKEDDIKTAV